MKNSSVLLLIVCSVAVVTTACQPTDSKRSSRKIRLQSGTRSKQHYNFGDSEKTSGDQTPVVDTTTGAAAPTATVDTTNALCDRVVEGKCDAIRVQVLEDGTFAGIDRTEAANAGLAKTISENEETISGKTVEIKIKFDELKNRGTHFIAVIASSNETTKLSIQEKLNSLKLENLTIKDMPSAQALTKTPKEKILVIAATKEDADAAKTSLGIAEIMTLVVENKWEPRTLREEILSYIGTVVPVNFVTRHLKSEVIAQTLQVRLDGRLLEVSKDFGTSLRERMTKLRIYILKRERLNANSEIKITYTLK